VAKTEEIKQYLRNAFTTAAAAATTKTRSAEAKESVERSAAPPVTAGICVYGISHLAYIIFALFKLYQELLHQQ